MSGMYDSSNLTLDNCSKDLVNGLVIGDGVVEDKEVSLEPLRDVPPAASLIVIFCYLDNGFLFVHPADNF